MVPAYFAEVKNGHAFWFFLRDTGSTAAPEQQETVRLQNGFLVNKHQKFIDGTIGEILDHDFFTIDANCIFQLAERKDPRSIKIPKTNSKIELGSLKIRVKFSDREYFLKNATISVPAPWLCFYERDYQNKALVLLRAVGIVTENGNGKNESGKNGKNGKNLK